MNKRNGAIEILRFLFAVQVAALHGSFFGIEYMSAFLSVEFFFILTGILMAHSIERTRTSENGVGTDTALFMKRKVCGLMPNYYVAWVISFIAAQFSQHSTVEQMVKNFANSYGELLLVGGTGMYNYSVNNPTWYISTMLFALLLLYPLARKFGKDFRLVIAPIIFLFLMGYTYQNYELLSYNDAPGRCRLYRAMMEICFGYMGYGVATKMREYRWSRFARIVTSIIEIGLYAIVFCYMNTVNRENKFAWVIVYVIGIAVTLTYSGIGIHIEYCNNKLSYWLGEISYNIYLGHCALIYVVWYFGALLSIEQQRMIYVLGTICNSLFIMYFSKFLRYIWKKHRNKMSQNIVNNIEK